MSDSSFIQYVNVIIFDPHYQKIAYLKKMKGPSFLVNKFNFIGGKLELNETHKQAAVREVKEEAGIDIEESALIEVCFVEEATWNLKNFCISVSQENFDNITAQEEEPIFKDFIEKILNDSIDHSNLYSPDFFFFLNKVI